MQSLFLIAALISQTPQEPQNPTPPTKTQPPPAAPTKQPPVPGKTLPLPVPPKSTPQSPSPQVPSKATPQASNEVLGPDYRVFIRQRGYECVAAKVLQGDPSCVGKWRVKYRVNTPGGTATYTASGYGAQSYAQAGGTDSFGFVNWLNGVRASYGLPPVGYEPNLSNWAAVNNGQQAARGMGHHVMGPARRQNAGMGGPASTIWSMWMQSPGHRAALLDPTIRWVGIAASGQWWTFNAS
jgi:uncharacterized protein YkwD